MVPDPRQGWQEATIVRSGRDQQPALIESKDGKLSLEVASPYFNYLHARYPGARIWTKDRLNAVIFIVDGTLRGSVMPIAKQASAQEPATK